MPGLHADVPALLAAQGIDAAETPMVTSGFSGARHSSIAQDGRRYVLKRLRFEDDWLMRLTADVHYREAEFAASSLVDLLPAGVAVPMLGASYDGEGRAILMRDISETLFTDGEVVPPMSMDATLRGIADLHAAFWGKPPQHAIACCDPRRRIGLLGPATGEALISERRDFGVARGWRSFDLRVPREISSLLHRLQDDMTPLLEILEAFPAALLHGDLKIANFGLDSSALWLFDWSSVMWAPVAVDLALFLTMSSRALPWTLDEVCDRYSIHLERALGSVRFADARWPAQRAAMMLCGLLYYGWGKALDAEAGRADELRWWCDGAVEAARTLGL
jgi:Phosphotransferase enzyme family